MSFKLKFSPSLTHIAMEPLMYPDFHVKNDKFYSKFYETAYMQELIHSIFSTLLSFTLTLLFLSISNVLYHLSWWCCYILSYLQNLIHSIFSSLLRRQRRKDRMDELKYIAAPSRNMTWDIPYAKKKEESMKRQQRRKDRTDKVTDMERKKEGLTTT